MSGRGGFGDGTWLQTFLQWPVIASRLLLWLGAAERVDGWLFWAIDNWNLAHGRPLLKRINQTLLTNAADFEGVGTLGNTGDGVLIYGDELGPAPGLRCAQSIPHPTAQPVDRTLTWSARLWWLDRYVNLADGIEGVP